MGKAELNVLSRQVAVWSDRLRDLSWYMRCLNEAIARRANQEDQCAGRFWEGCFKCQALLDEKALTACLACVDLNPVRAATAQTPEESDFTAIRRRIHHQHTAPKTQPAALYPFVGYPREPMPKGLPIHLDDYLELVDIHTIKSRKRPVHTPVWSRKAAEKRSLRNRLLNAFECASKCT